MATTGHTTRKCLKKVKLRNTWAIPQAVPTTIEQNFVSQIDGDAENMLRKAQEEDDSIDAVENLEHRNQNCLVIQGPISRLRESNPCTATKLGDPSNFEVCTVDSFPSSKRMVVNPRWLLYALLAMLGLFAARPVLAERMMGFFVLALFAYLLYHVTFKRNMSSPMRVITWRLDEFSNELKTGFLSSPEFHGSTCRWRLVIRQKCFPRGVQTSFGIIATNIPSNLERLEVNVNFSVTNSEGQDLVLDVKKLTVNGVFESEGDCGYSANVLITRDQVADDKIQIKCCAAFTATKVGILKQLSINDQNEVCNKGPRKVAEVGFISPEACDSEPCEILYGTFRMMSFIQDPDTKSFVWKIPSFKTEIQMTECWGIHSPSVVVNSHGVCSIWRLKLVELHGSYRIHLQVRGLPRTIAQIMVCYTVELMDNFGDFVFPEGCYTKVEYPDYLSIWGTTRMPLYSRQALMTRFFANDTGLTFRISLNVEPVENSSLRCLRGTNSCEWIVSRQNW